MITLFCRPDGGRWALRAPGRTKRPILGVGWGRQVTGRVQENLSAERAAHFGAVSESPYFTRNDPQESTHLTHCPFSDSYRSAGASPASRKCRGSAFLHKSNLFLTILTYTLHVGPLVDAIAPGSKKSRKTVGLCLNRSAVPGNPVSDRPWVSSRRHPSRDYRTK